MKPPIASLLFSPEPAVAPAPAAPAAPVAPVPAAAAAPGPAAPAAAPAAPPAAPAAPAAPLPAAAAPVVPAAVAPAAPVSVVPDTYTLVPPPGSFFSQLDVDAMAPEFKALQLSNEQGQAVIQVRADILRAQAESYLAEAKADPEVGGAKWEASLTDARRGRDALFPPGTKGADLIRGLLDLTGFGNHAEIIRAFARAGRTAREDRGPGGAGGSSAPPDETLEQRAARQLYGSTTPPAR